MSCGLSIANLSPAPFSTQSDVEFEDMPPNPKGEYDKCLLAISGDEGTMSTKTRPREGEIFIM